MSMGKQTCGKIGLLLVTLLSMGCGNQYQLQDQTVVEQQQVIPDPEYVDFSDLPLSDFQDNESTSVPPTSQQSSPPQSERAQRPDESSPSQPQPQPQPPEQQQASNEEATPRQQEESSSFQNRPEHSMPDPIETTPSAQQPVASESSEPTQKEESSPVEQTAQPAPTQQQQDQKEQTQTTPSPTTPRTETPKPLPRVAGVGTGTVYYLPVYGEKRNCPKNDYAMMKDEEGKNLALLCKEEVSNCAMQGSCFYVNEQGSTLYAYRKMVKIENPKTKKMISQPRFRVNKEASLCPQGMGARRTCLDPYRSVAADPKFHKIGDVIFIPLLRNQKLPNNEIHDGYLIVRDTGGAIKGEGRFDFFIGFDDYHGHLFSDLKLADKTGKFQYYRVPEEVAQKVRLARRFPMVPASVKENAYASMMDVLGLRKTLSEMKNTVSFYRLKWDL